MNNFIDDKNTYMFFWQRQKFMKNFLGYVYSFLLVTSAVIY